MARSIGVSTSLATFSGPALAPSASSHKSGLVARSEPFADGGEDGSKAGLRLVACLAAEEGRDLVEEEGGLGEGEGGQEPLDRPHVPGPLRAPGLAWEQALAEEGKNWGQTHP